MNTKKFRTKTEMIKRDNGKIQGVWEISIDVGYSGVKVFSPNAICVFPYYAKKVENDFQFAGREPASAILYKDLISKQMWLVGEVAQNTMSAGNTSDSETSLYGRERYGSPLFRVALEAGLGLGYTKNEYYEPLPDDRIVIQTGLPERYLNTDTGMLTESIAGEHHFALKVGSGEWKEYHFSITADNVFVMSQPKGTLFSVCINRDGKSHPDAQKYLSSSVIIFDPGFGTFDLFSINSGAVGRGETYSDLGMLRVLTETAKKIKDDIGVTIPVPAMQKYLETGTVKLVDRKNFTAKEVPFEELLMKSNNEVCEEAILRMAGAFNLEEYNYLVVTGGTGAAWLHKIEEKFKNFETLSIIKGNQNDELPLIYMNARGYYYYRFSKLRVGQNN